MKRALKFAGVGMIALAVLLLLMAFVLAMTGYMPPALEDRQPDYMLRALTWAAIWGLSGIALAGYVSDDEGGIE